MKMSRKTIIWLTLIALTITTYADGDRQLPVSSFDSDLLYQKRSEAMTMYHQFRNIDLEGIMNTAEFKTDPASIAWSRSNDTSKFDEFESHVIRKNYQYVLKLRDGIGTITYYKTKDPDWIDYVPQTTGVPIVRQARAYMSIELSNSRGGYDTVARLEVYFPESNKTSLPINDVLKGDFRLSVGAGMQKD
jgi:hypothetical protein